MGISTLNFSLSFTLALILISSIFTISFKTDSVMALTEVSTECRGSNSETKETESEDAHRFNEKGLDLLDSGKYQQALEYFDMASDEDPNLAVSINNKGVALSNLERYEEAIEQYDKA